MSFIIDRKETDTEIVLTYKYGPLYYVVMIACVVLSVWSNWSIWVLIVAAIVFLIDMHKPTKEIKQAMKQGSVEIRGSKFSMKNPLTATIKK